MGQSFGWQLRPTTRTSRDTRTCVIRVSTGKTPFAKTGLLKISGLRPFPVNQGLPSAPVPASGVYLGKYSSHFPGPPPAVGSPLLVSRGGVVSQDPGRRLRERSAVDSAPRPTVVRLRRGPFRPPFSSAQVQRGSLRRSVRCRQRGAPLSGNTRMEG